MKNILITGGAGFIGSHVVRKFVLKYPDYHIINLDALTYAGNLENLSDIAQSNNYTFIKGDINNQNLVEDIFRRYSITHVIHLAAESHVDRSIKDPLIFLKTNVLGTANLLQIAKNNWADRYNNTLFYHVSTDEVYGTLDIGPELFTENTPYDPRSPYSASKAASDHLVMAFHHTYGMHTVMSNCSNNYGPNHFPEKLIPLVINNIIHKKPIPVYGQGKNVRDWLYVEDHADAIDTVFHRGKNGHTYNIGGHNEWQNIDIVKLLCTKLDEKLNRTPGESAQLITFVQDRAGHNLRYAIDSSKIKNELGWMPNETFETGIEKTIAWYLNNSLWLERVTSGAYLQYYEDMYTK